MAQLKSLVTSLGPSPSGPPVGAKNRRAGGTLKRDAKEVQSRLKSQTVNGLRYDADSDIVKIKNGLQQVSKRGLASTSLSPVLTIDFSAEAFMFSIGCIIVRDELEKEKTYSLKDSQTNRQTIHNENIFDAAAYSRIRNKNIKLDDSFCNDDDPIFELDDAPPKRAQREREKAQEKESPDIIGVSGEIANTNSQPGQLVLKQFLST